MAKILGPYFFGIWGFINLVLSYLSYTNMGIQYAINVELSLKDKKNHNEVALFIGNSLFVTLCICTILVLIYIVVKISGIDLFPTYSFSQYALLVTLIASLNQFGQVFANIYRSYGRVSRIAITEILLSVFTLLCVFIFKGVTLIEGLLFTMASVGLISIIIYMVRSPIKIKLSININIIKTLLSKGLALLIYSISFNLIMLSATTIISIFYSVEKMGCFSLANSITTATLLGLGAITWVLFPTFLWKLRADITDVEARAIVTKITKVYSTIVYLIVFIVIMVSPLIFLYLTQYAPLAPALNYLLLSQAILSSCIAYNSLAISRNKQYSVVRISLMSLALVLVMGLLVAYLKLEFTVVALTVLMAITAYSTFQTRLGNSLIGIDTSIVASIKQILPLNLIIPVLIIIIGNIMDYPQTTGLIGLMIFVVLNYRDIIYSLNESCVYLKKLSRK